MEAVRPPAERPAVGTRGRPTFPLWFARGRPHTVSSTARGARVSLGPHAVPSARAPPSRPQCLPEARSRATVTLGTEGLPAALGARSVHSTGVRARVCVVARGQQARPGAAGQRSVETFGAHCAACAAPCGPRGIWTLQSPAVTPPGPHAVRAPQAGVVQTWVCLSSSRPLLSACGPCGGRVRGPHCLQLSCPEGGGWGPGTELGSLLLRASRPTHSWCFKPGFLGPGSVVPSPVARRF